MIILGDVILSTNSGSCDKIFTKFLKDFYFDLVCIDEGA